MVSIFTGAGAGFQRGSGNILGGAGLLGSAVQGRSGESVSVNAATGNLLISQQDDFLIGRGPDSAVTRTYNSLAQVSDDNGDHWRFGAQRRLQNWTGTANTAGATVDRIGEDGSVITYTYDTGLGYYRATDGAGAHDKIVNTGHWTWTDGNSRATEVYDIGGNLINLTDTDGNSIAYSYHWHNNAWRLSRATTANGEYQEYIWSGENVSQIVTGYTDLATSTAKTLTRTRHAYDGLNRLIQVTVDLSPTDNSIADGKTYVTNYSYDGSSRRVATITQTDGSSLAIAYDGAGRVVTLTQTVAAGDVRTTTIDYQSSNYTVISDAQGWLAAITTNASGELIRLDERAANGSSQTRVTDFVYDGNGNLLRTGRYDGVGGAAFANIWYRYDANGNMLDSYESMVSGYAVTRWTYGSNNEVLTKTRFTTQDLDGHGGADPTGALTTRYAYDSRNHLRYTVSPEGRVTEYYYDGYGQMYWSVEYPQASYDVSGLAPGTSISETSLNAWRTSFDNTYSKISQTIYDARGNVTRAIDYGRAQSSWGYGDASDGYNDTYFTYDQAGRLLSRNELNEVAETFFYDGMGRMVGSTDLAGGTTSIVFNDAASQTVITLGNGQVTSSTYNKAGELVSTTQGSDWSPSATSAFKYDKNGRLRMATDALGYNSYYLYDKAGRKTAEVSHIGELVEYRYDKFGRVAATIRYHYAPAAAQLAALANPDNGLTIDNLRTSADSGVWLWNIYDTKGRLVEEITGDGRVTAFTYDDADRLIETRKYINLVSVGSFMTTAPTSVVLPSAHASDAITRYFYDRDSRAIGSLDAEGYLTEAVYDKAGQLVGEIAYAQRTHSAYWASGTFDQLRSTAAPGSSADRHVRHVYDGRGMRRYSIDAQGGASSFGYNAAGQLVQTTVHAAPISTTNFNYDNVKALVNSIANGSNDRTSTIAYNSRGQIASTTSATGLVTSFTYDVMGNVIKTVAGSGGSAVVTRSWYTQKGELRFSVDGEGYVTEHNYDARGQVSSTIRYDTATSFGDGTSIGTVAATVAPDYSAGRYQRKSFGYSAKGQLTDTYDADNIRTNVWFRGNGEVGQVQTALGTSDYSIPEYFGYNHSGQLTWKGEAWEQSESRETSYTYDGLGNLTSVVDPNGKTTSYTYDKLGRVTSVTDALGNQTLYQYDAFGNKTAIRDARLNWTYNNYDNLGRLWRTTDASGVNTDSAYNRFGELASVTRAGATTSFLYDKAGQVTQSTDARGFVETYAYDLLGNRVRFTNKLGGVTNYTYDRKGQLRYEWVDTKAYDNAGNVAADGFYKNIYEYDARGNVLRRIEAYGLAERRDTNFVYDKNDRLIETIGQTFLGMTPREYIRYDARGNVTSTVNAAGGRTIFYYDDLDRKTVEISPTGTYTRYTYDDVGNVTEVRVFETIVGVPADGGSEEEAPGAPGGNARVTSFTYDNVNRMLTSSVASVNSYITSGGAHALQATTLHTAYQYDANGNVVKLTDANGNASYYYYNALGQKTHQVDAENYLTAWTYDAEGNVLWEYRYNNKVSAAPQVGVLPNVATSSSDRYTSFTYDLAGNRLTETRHNVLVHNGSGAHTYTNSTIGYSYNALGQVTRKSEATGDFVDYVYDTSGRLTLEARKAYTDHSGASVTPTVDYYYNGVNDLSRTRQRGSGDAAERVTTYGYDGGKLRWITDAEGNSRYYWYDQGGRQNYEYYTRTKSDGSVDTSYNGNLTGYDVAGRVVSKWQADYTGGGWTTRGPVTELSYNAFGEVAGTYVGGLLQQQNQYDLGGRLVATTSGDGIWKYFGYDGNGNQTIAISSAGANLAGLSFDAARGLIGQADVNASFTVYDKRNLAATVFEEGRQFSVGGALQNLTTTRTYTAFGEVASETNALGATINYSYNAMGRMIRNESPLVEIVLENGTGQWIRPAEDYYYDASGRLVATRDANGSYSGSTKTADTGNLTRLTLLTGTGYGNSQALVTAETHADGGVKQTRYDIHGDARVLIDEIGRSASRTYDRMGRAVTVSQIGGLVDYYSYDLLGQQIKHWNNHNQTPVYGPAEPYWVEDPYSGYGYWEYYTPIIGYTPDVETTDYDIQGRVVSQRSFGGDTTTTAYTWDGAIATPGIGTFGGWLQTTTMANGLYAQEKTDLFGRLTWKRDLAGRTTDHAYDLAGRMTSSSTNGMLVSFVWFNSGLQASTVIGTPNAGQVNTSWSRKTATYSYNATGNRLTETLVDEYGYYSPEWWEYPSNPGGGPPYYLDPYEPYYYDPIYHPESYSTSSVQIKNQSATYDALGRMKSWAEAGTASSPASSTTTSYDANGNIRRTVANYSSLDANGAASTATTRDYWFRYDSMNRVVVNQGALENGTIVRGTGAYLYGTGGGQDIMYDVAGQRTAVATTQAYYDSYTTYYQESRETYLYDAAGRLSQVQVSQGAAASGSYDPVTYAYIPPASIPAAPSTGTLRSVFYYDLMGRMTSQTDYDTNGYTALYSRTAAYNAKGQLSYDSTWTKKTDNKIYSSSTSYYFTDYNSGQYLLGSVGWTSSSTSVTGGSTTYSRSVNGYAWWDGAVQVSIVETPNTSQSTTHSSSFYLNSFGQLTGAYVGGGKAHYVSFTLDELGQIIRRDESQPSGQTGAPHEVWYRFGGRQLGYTGNNGTSDVTYDASLNERRIVQPTSPGTYRNGQFYGASYADFAQNYDPINSYYQGAAGGTYTVQQGDTLQGIAQSLWGDASLWYKLAEANGMSGAGGLIEGQTLILPTGVMRSKNNAATLNPYNPSETIGDLSPTAPQPPKKAKNKCGVFGQILLAVVAIAVTYFSAGTLTAAMGPVLGGAAAGVAGSVVSQAVGLATGIQDKFSWKSVGMAAIGGAVGGGLKELGRLGDLGKLGSFSKVGSFIGGSGFASTVTRAMAGSALTQGIGVATGLQDKFSWAGVAAAGVGAAAGYGMGKLLGANSITDEYDSFGNRTAVGDTSLSNHMANLGKSAANMIANAATRSLIEGTDFGDNVLAALPDVIAQTVGDMLIHGVDMRTREQRVEAARSELDQRIPPSIRDQVQAAGGPAFQVDDDGRLAVNLPVDPETGNIKRSGRVSFGDNKEFFWGVDGVYVNDGSAYHTIRTGRYAPDGTDTGRDDGDVFINFDTNQSISILSLWFGWTGDSGATRLLMNQAGIAGLYASGRSSFPSLGITVAYGMTAPADFGVMAGGTSVSNPASDQTGPIGMGFDYFLGLGSNHRYFGPGSPFSNTFAQGNGAQAFERFATEKYLRGDLGDGSLLVDNFDYRFGIDRFFGTANLAEHYVGSWQDGRAYIVGDEIRFVVQNTASTSSLLYGRPLNEMGLPSIPSFESEGVRVRTPLGDFQSSRIPLSNIHMTIEWSIPLPRRQGQ